MLVQDCGQPLLSERPFSHVAENPSPSRNVRVYGRPPGQGRLARSRREGYSIFPSPTVSAL